MASRVKGITIEIGGDVTGLDKALQGVNSEIRTTEKNLKDVERLLKLDPGNTELIQQKQKLLKEEIGKTKDKLDQLREADKIAKQQLDSGDLGQDKYDALQREIAETESKLDGLQQKAKEFGGTMSQHMQLAGDKMQDIGSKMSDVGGTMTQKVTVPIVGVGTAVVKTAADFEAQMDKVAAISGATGGDLEKLEKKAREMGENTKFSATEAGEAFEYMAMAGWKSEDMISGIDGVLNLAAASGADLATTSDIVTDALTAFGMSAEEAGHLADIMAAASSNANTNVEMMGETFKYVAPVAGAMGYSAEDVSVAIGLMANSGIKASQAGTSLRTMMTNMANPTKNMKEAMDTLGISLDDGQGNMKSFREIMDDLRSGFGDLKIPLDEYNRTVEDLQAKMDDGTITAEEYDEEIHELNKRAYGAEGAMKAQAAAMLAGKTGMSGLLAVVNASEEDYNKLTGAINDCNGVSQEMADIMMDNLSGDITKVKSKLQEIAIQLAKTLMPMIKDGVAWLQKVLDKFSNLDPKTQKLIVKIGMIAAVVGPVLLVVGKIIAVVGSVVSGIGSVVGAVGAASAAAGGLIPMIAGIAAAAAPFLIGGAIIAGIIAAIVLIVKHWDDIKEAAGKVKEKVGQMWEGAKEKASEVWGGVKDTVKNAYNAIKDVPVIGPIFETITGTLKNQLDFIKNIFTGDWSAAWDNVKNIAGGAVDGVKGVFGDVKDAAGKAWEVVKDVPVIGPLMDEMKNVMSLQIDFVKNVFTGNWSGAWEDIKGIFGGFVDNIKAGFDTIKDFTSSKFSEIHDTISGKWDTIKTKSADTLKIMADVTWQKSGEMLSAVNDKFEQIKQGISDKINSAKDTVSNVIDKIKKLFNFEWKLPELKLPHIVVGSYIDVPVLGTIPDPRTLDVQWYKKAMDIPRILKNAQIFGAAGGKLLGGGEAGEEVVSGKNTLLQMIRNAVASVMSVKNSGYNAAMQDTLQAARVMVQYGNVYMTVNGAEGQDVSELADAVSERLKGNYEREKAVWA